MEYEKYNARYDEKSGLIIAEGLDLVGDPIIPRELLNRDYHAVQELTDGKFFEFYNPVNPPADCSFGGGRIGIEKGHINKLNFWNLGLTELKDSLKELTFLKYLNLSSNRLDKIPEFLYHLKSLVYLDAANNKISNLSKEVRNLENLSSLDLSNNQISCIPKCLENLKHLRYLNLRNNQITSIDHLNINGRRVQLELDGNPLSLIDYKEVQ